MDLDDAARAICGSPPSSPRPRADADTRRLRSVEMMGAGPRMRDGEEVEGPAEAELGTVGWRGWPPRALAGTTSVTEDPDVGDTEIWEIYNTTADAHPIHIHEVEVRGRRPRGTLRTDGEDVALPVVPTGDVRPPEAWEAGRKDTVLAYPGEVTRIRATFAQAGQYVWHCHILEHEDNEMMRPYRIGPEQPGQPAPKPDRVPARPSDRAPHVPSGRRGSCGPPPAIDSRLAVERGPAAARFPPAPCSSSGQVPHGFDSSRRVRCSRPRGVAGGTGCGDGPRARSARPDQPADRAAR